MNIKGSQGAPTFGNVHSPSNFFAALSILLFFCVTISDAQAIKKFGAVPSASQLRWHDLEYYMFIHFGPNTFTNQEWGTGLEDPKVFNPTKLDCRQWARTARFAGMKGIIITAKHHDGFCLWPSKYSTHTVRQSPWKDGRGDVLKELSDACKAEGLKFGVYLSPWDRNHPLYGTSEYNNIFSYMLNEVLGNYGEVFEQWFDGANGEGPNGKKQEYDWKLFHKTVYSLQKDAIIFSDGGPGCRWVGNENGYAGETNWNTLNGEKVYPGYPNYKELTLGHEDGTHWIPAESDVSIRPGWFYSPDTDGKVKSVDALVDIYLGSVGRGSNLLLNVPVNRDGLIAKEDSIRLMDFNQSIKKMFAVNLMVNAKILGEDKEKRLNLLSDQDKNTFWYPRKRDGEVSIEIEWAITQQLKYVVLREHIALGQRVKGFTVELFKDGKFVEVAKGTTIGYKRILKLGQQQATRLRIRITESKATPILNEVEIY
jgi:alpha-L-fucosidase